MKDIPYDRLPRGIVLCIGNATRLLEDAKLLRDCKRFPSALVSAIFAYEELGKAISLREKWIKKENLTLRDWRQMLDHVKKAYHTNKFIRRKSGRQFNSDDKDFERELQRLEDNMLTFDATERSTFEKESNLYVNWTKTGWISPVAAHNPRGINQVQYKIEDVTRRRISEVSQALEDFINEEDTQQVLNIREIDWWMDANKIQIDLIMLLSKFDPSLKIETIFESDRITKVKMTYSTLNLTGEEKKKITFHFRKYKTMEKTKFIFIAKQ